VNDIRFPGESEAYRTARNELLDAERRLRAEIERVASLRRALPPGGVVPHDYVFQEGRGDARDVRLSSLFGENDTLVLYSFMFGPKAEEPCPMCTSFLDSLDAQAPHIRQRVALAVTAKSPIGRVLDFADERGWKRLRLVSSSSSTYQRDYHGETDAGAQMPMMNVFTKHGAEVRHFWGSELLYATDRERDGMDSRHIDIVWPLWNVLDLTPGGRGTSWYPELEYR
jgi:predicted dithiol-disulfide oxidoreductase (DUF899 family)